MDGDRDTPNFQPSHIANFDSATAMLRGLSRFLKGKDFPMLGTVPKPLGPLARVGANVLNRFPVEAKKKIYIWSGRAEAYPPRKLHRAYSDEIAQWMVDMYPRRQYPAMMVGSSNGALMNLCAAMGVPWLPQTSLVPVKRSGVHADEPFQELCWAEKPIQEFLDANPYVTLHHMHDPNQDRLMVQRMTYFRFKRLVLGNPYENFIRENLAPGGTLFIVDCKLTWPTTKIRDRCVFQFGALGGASKKELMKGSERVADFLAEENSHRRRWEPPIADAERPEAEWGFEPLLGNDIERFAKRFGYKVRRISFEEPEHFSPCVADLYDWWNKKRGVLGRRLLVESFLLTEPYWTIRTGSVPFWTVFNKEPSEAALMSYLDDHEAFDQIAMILFSHGMESVGLTPIERWKALLARARKRGDFLGVDETTYPRHFNVMINYYYDLLEKVQSRYPLPRPLKVEQLDEFFQTFGARYQVQIH